MFTRTSPKANVRRDSSLSSRQMNNIVLAADLGGTNLRVAAVDREGRLVHRVRRDTPRSSKADSIIRSIVEAADECRSAAADRGDITTFGVTVPGPIDFERGMLTSLPNLPCLNGVRIVDEISRRLDIDVVLENDGTAAAIGEQWLGASRGIDSSICVTLGTGIGGGIVIDGIPLRGKDGTAAELGHICVEPFGVECGCGSTGCVEQYSSASAIVRMAGELSAEYPGSTLNGRLDLSSADVYEAGIAGDALAVEVFRRMGFYLGIALAGLLNVLNPDLVVIGGGTAAGWDLFIGHTRDQIEKRAFRQPAERAKLVRAKLGDDAGILGAARLAFSNEN